GVDYLIVGAHALAVHGHVRATKDLDVWVRPSPDNAARVLKALLAFGAPILDLTQEDLASPGVVFQIGVPPVRIDVLTQIDGVEFDVAWSERVVVTRRAGNVYVLSKRLLIVNKQASGRLQDLADVERLRDSDGPDDGLEGA
ncbi:MAG TPA: hypothetical protein ENK43_06780, partial [Planctomycetes bacterium]|nr:hypothetical protein [Planctomycetota bacterium]